MKPSLAPQHQRGSARRVRLGGVSCALICSSLFVAALSSAALSSAAPNRAETLLQQSMTHYATADFTAAVRKLELASQATDDPHVLANIYVLLGLSHAELQQIAHSRAAFIRALAYDPERSLSTSRFKPAVVKLFDEVKKAQHGTLTVTVRQGSGVVVLDGSVIGQAPFRGEAPIGRHKIEIQRADGQLQDTREVVIYPGQTTAMNLEGQPAPESGTGPRSPEPPPVQRAVEVATTAEDRRVDESRRSKLIWGTVGLGVAGVAVLAGGICYGVATKQGNVAHDKYRAAADPTEIEQRWSDVEAAQRKQIAGYVLFSTAAVAAVLGLYALLTRPPPQHKTTASWEIWGGSTGFVGGASLGVRGGF